MSSNDNENNPQKEKSFLETIREIDEKERLREQQEELEREERIRKREEQQKKAYQERLRQEHIELMKLKQGVISEDDIPKEEKVEKQYTVWEKIQNFFYHNKAYLIVGVCAAALAAFIIYDIATKVYPDVTVLYINNDPNMEFYMDQSSELLQPYCPDFNGDGKNILKVYYIPAIYDDLENVNLQVAEANRTKLVAEFQSGESIMIIGDMKTYEAMEITGDGILADMREIFPDDENALRYGYKLSGTSFKEKIGYTGLDDDNIYISLRLPRKTVGVSVEKMTENYERAEEVLRNYISENRIS